MSKTRKAIKSVVKRYDEFLIEIYGKRKIVMEGCKKVLFYDENEIKLKGDMTIRIVGKGLCLKQVGNNNVIVEGVILGIEFSE